MPKQNKFENVDVLASLNAVLKQNTGFYQSDFDIDRLFSMLPYKTLSFSKIEGRHGTYALIDKGENRDKEIKKPRPSVRAQLTADKKTAAPKKTAAKRKNHDLEV